MTSVATTIPKTPESSEREPFPSSPRVKALLEAVRREGNLVHLTPEEVAVAAGEASRLTSMLRHDVTDLVTGLEQQPELAKVCARVVRQVRSLGWYAATVEDSLRAGLLGNGPTSSELEERFGEVAPTSATVPVGGAS